MAAVRIQLGELTLVRVPYVDVLVPPEVVGLELADLERVAWADERWTADGQVRVGACAWVVSRGDDHLVIDPFNNADDIFHDPGSAEVHAAAMRAAFRDAGVPVESVGAVLRSHVEGIGMLMVRDGDGWAPMFPAARVLLAAEALPAIDDPAIPHWSDDLWRALRDDGRIEAFASGAELLGDVRAEVTGGHAPGHTVVHLGPAGAPIASSVGHLAISPLHLSTGPCPAQHPDPGRAWAALRALADDGRLLFGPLWPGSGAGRAVGDRFEPHPA